MTLYQIWFSCALIWFGFAVLSCMFAKILVIKIQFKDKITVKTRPNPCCQPQSPKFILYCWLCQNKACGLKIQSKKEVQFTCTVVVYLQAFTQEWLVKLYTLRLSVSYFPSIPNFRRKVNNFDYMLQRAIFLHFPCLHCLFPLPVYGSSQKYVSSRLLRPLISVHIVHMLNFSLNTAQYLTHFFIQIKEFYCDLS